MARQKPWTGSRLQHLQDRVGAGLSNREIAAEEGVTPEAISWAIKRYILNNTPPAKERHGMTGTPMYKLWWGMICRCAHPVTNNYARYGGRGIKVCERWKKFDNFLEDMGMRPEGMTLDRIDNNGNYEPSNCRWVTRNEQQRNRSDNVSIEWFGKAWIQSDLCLHLDVQGTHIPRNMARGMSRIEAIQHLVNLKEKRNAKVNPAKIAVPG
jgi:hypothetical protein